MRAFRDLSLRAKLLISFGSVLLLTGVLGAASITELQSVKRSADIIALNALPSMEAIGTIHVDEQTYRRDQLIHLINNDPKLAAQLNADSGHARQEVAATFAGYRSLVSNGQDYAYWRSAQAGWNAYLAASAALNKPNASARQPAMVAVVMNTRQLFTNLHTTLGKWSKLNADLGRQEQRNSVSTYNTGLLLTIIVLAAALLAGIGIALAISGSIRRAVATVLDRINSLQENCITFIQDGLKAFADGDLTHTYAPATEAIPNPSKDEIGKIAEAVNSIRDKAAEAIDAYNQTQARLSEVVGQIGQSATSVSASSQELTASSTESGRAADESGRAVGEIATAIGDIALGAQRQVETVAQVRSSAEEVGRAISEIAHGAQTQVEAVAQVRSAAEEVSRAIADIANGAEEQVRVVAVASTSAADVTSAAATASLNVKETAAAAHDAREVARAGVTAAEQATEAMSSVRDSSQEVNAVIRELAAKSEQIGEIVGTITGIAQQTNLLALNAAIEAARAGEQGRGFAVVAEEVRKLAEESQGAASEISDLIGAIQSQTGRAVEVVSEGAQRTEDGVAVVSQAREAFERIGEAVDDMTGRIDQIASISEQIAASAQTMQESVDSVAAVAEQASASAQQVAASAQQVSSSADLVASSAEQASAAAQQVSASAQQVSASADQVAASAEQASSTTQQVSASAEEVSASTEESSASAQQVAASAQALSDNAQLLAELVAQFKVAEARQTVAA